MNRGAAIQQAGRCEGLDLSVTPPVLSQYAPLFRGLAFSWSKWKPAKDRRMSNPGT